MEKNPQRDITAYAKWPVIQDGLGYNALLVGGMPGKNKDGNEIVKLTIRTVDEIIRKRYNWRLGHEVDLKGDITLEVEKMDMIQMNPYDEANRKWLYLKSWSMEDTPIFLREKQLRILIDFWVKQSNLLESANIRLNEQLELAVLNPAKFLKQYGEVYQDAINSAASAFSNRKEENK